MTIWATRGAQVVLVLGMMGCLTVQTIVLLSSPVRDRFDMVLVLLGILVVACVEVAIVCLWHLLSLARTDVIFSRRSFRSVDVIIGCGVVAGAIVLALAAILAPLPDIDGPAPGMILFLGMCGLGCWGVALLVVVMRGLLRRAIDWRDELEVVI